MGTTFEFSPFCRLSVGRNRGPSGEKRFGHLAEVQLGRK